MSTDLKLLKVVAFDAAGRAVLTPLNKWKLAYSERHAMLEIKCAGYVKRYDLRHDLAAVAPGETRQKVALGKTVGRLALTGLLHGRHAAGADLRWGGVDRDEAIGLYFIFNDTTMVSMELESDEVEALLKSVPSGVTSEEAYAAAAAQSKRVKAMARDGSRVLDEMDAQGRDLEGQLVTAHPIMESGASFDEREQARERCGLLQLQLGQLHQTRRAVVYELAASGVATGQPLIDQAKSIPAAAPAVTSAPQVSVAAPTSGAQPVAMVASPVSAPCRDTRQRSAASKVAKVLTFIVGAGIGFMVSLLLMLFLAPWGVLLIPFVTIGGGWLAVKMLNALMRR
ncbi:hypothetical protein RCH10_005205 [Variovorax sp. GrIS 2.14]|uniref:hypothetical protein n=1 Tax=Variovorax sp. GrIS 2.14 TaxID=3071709 RepID=UPI0038F70E19